MTKVTIKDIAKRVGVSPTTVSNVINGRHGKVSSDTIRKINAVIEELNYVPDFSARSLVSKRSRMIGVIIPQTEEHRQFLLENPFYSEFISGIENKLRAEGYYMMLTGVDKDTTYLDILVNWNLDAIVLLGIYKEGLYEQLKEVKVPVLLIDSYVEDQYFHHLRIDDELGGYLATKHLIDKGHREIAMVTGQLKENGVSDKRFAGYIRALEERGIAFKEEYLFEDSVSYEWGVEAAAKICGLPGVSAVCCTADLIATGVLTGLHNAGVNVPNEMSVIGFDNLSISKMTYPALTTVNQNIFAKGARAAETVLDIVNKGINSVKKEQWMEVSILERGTVQALER